MKSCWLKSPAIIKILSSCLFFPLPLCLFGAQCVRMLLCSKVSIVTIAQLSTCWFVIHNWTFSVLLIRERVLLRKTAGSCRDTLSITRLTCLASAPPCIAACASLCASLRLAWILAPLPRFSVCSAERDISSRNELSPSGARSCPALSQTNDFSLSVDPINFAASS